MLAALTREVEARHPWTKGHATRVADLAVTVAHALDWDEAEIERLRVGCLLHDVGKLSLTTALLGKPGPLSVLEQVQMRTHPAAGARLIAHMEAAQSAL